MGLRAFWRLGLPLDSSLALNLLASAHFFLTGGLIIFKIDAPIILVGATPHQQLPVALLYKA